MMRLRSEETGATLILVAMSLFLLMGILALAVDVGLVRTERRVDQLAADTAVMAGALVWTQSTDAETQTEIINRVNTNLGRTLTVTDWNACVDVDALALGSLDTSPCISTEVGLETTSLRVRIPTQDVPTSFGRIMGFLSLPTFAAAEATWKVDEGPGVIPFGLLNGTNGEACLKDTSGPDPNLPPSCNDVTHVNGQFGPFTPYSYFVDPCKATNPAWAYSAARGLDHPLVSFDMPDWVAGGANLGAAPVTIEGCTAGVPDENPNTVDGQSGNKVSLLGQALLYGGSFNGVGYSGRLAVTSSLASAEANPSGGPIPIDNVPIWYYFTDTYGAVCNLAVDAALADLALTPPFTQAQADNTAAIACIAAWDYDMGDRAFLSIGLIDSPRLGFVPEYAEFGYSPAGQYHINQFKPVYLNTISMAAAGTYVTHWPSATGVFAGNQVKALTGIVLDCRMFFDTPCDQEFTAAGSGAQDINNLRLTK